MRLPRARRGPQAQGGMIVKLALSKITADQHAQPRAAMQMDKVEEYAEDMLRGDVFPPLVVFHDGKTHWLADGFHRFYAAPSVGITEIDCDVRPGTKRDAILFSCGANAQHGFRRTSEDKRRAVRKLLNDKKWVSWSDHEIGRRCAVAHVFVAKVRKEMNAIADTGNVSSMERTFTHSKTGEPTVMTFAPRPLPAARLPADGAMVAKLLGNIRADLHRMPSPREAVSVFPSQQGNFFPYSDLVEMAKWMTDFAECWRLKIAGKADDPAA